MGLANVHCGATPPSVMVLFADGKQFRAFPNCGLHVIFNLSLLVGDGCFGVKYVFAVPPFKSRGQQFVYSHHCLFLKRSTSLIFGCFPLSFPMLL